MSPDLSIDRAGPTVEHCAIRFGEFGVRQRSTHCTLALPACHQRDLLIERPIVSICTRHLGATDRHLDVRSGSGGDGAVLPGAKLRHW